MVVWLAVATVVLLLAGVLVGGVTMALGMLVHEASVLIVVLNAVRLLGARRNASTSLDARTRVDTGTLAPW